MTTVDQLTLKHLDHMAKNLAEIRSAFGLSLRKLAEDSEIHINTLSRWEQGHATPDIIPMMRVAKTLLNAGYTPPTTKPSRTPEEMLSYMRTLSPDVTTTRRFAVSAGAVEHWRKDHVYPPLKTMIRVEQVLDKEGVLPAREQ